MVVLRDFRASDKPQLVNILNDDSVTQFLSSKIPSPYTQDDASWWINEGSQGELIKAVTYDGILVGCIGVIRGEFEYQRSGEVGYWLAKDYWRKGITSKALQQLVEHVFEQTDIVRIHAAVFSGNQASMRLLVSAGFVQEAVLKKAIYKDGEFYEKHIFAKLTPC